MRLVAAKNYGRKMLIRQHRLL